MYSLLLLLRGGANGVSFFCSFLARPSTPTFWHELGESTGLSNTVNICLMAINFCRPWVGAKWPFTNGFKINQVTSLVLCCLRDWLLLLDHSALRLQWHLNFSRIFIWNLSSVFLTNVIGCHLVRKKPHFSPFKLHFHAFSLIFFPSFMIWKFILMSNVFSVCVLKAAGGFRETVF